MFLTPTNFAPAGSKPGRAVLVVAPVVGRLAHHEQATAPVCDDRGRAHRDLDTAEDAARVAKPPVEQAAEVPRSSSGRAPAGISRVADGQRHLGAGAGRVTGRGSRRVDDLASARLLDSGVEQPANEPDPVSCGAATRGVSRVQQEHGAALDLAPRLTASATETVSTSNAVAVVPEAAGQSIRLGCGRVQSPSATTTVLQPMPGASMYEPTRKTEAERMPPRVSRSAPRHQPRVRRVGQRRAVQRGQDQWELRVRVIGLTSPARPAGAVRLPGGRCRARRRAGSGDSQGSHPGSRPSAA